MRNLLIAVVAALALGVPAAHAAIPAHMFKNPGCLCCDAYARYLEAHGFEVTIRPVNDLDGLKHDLAIPTELKGCHTILLEDYVVEGHVPVEAIERLLAERPAVYGISVPGMPAGSPGMSGEREGPLVVMVYGEDGVRQFGRF